VVSLESKRLAVALDPEPGVAFAPPGHPARAPVGEEAAPMLELPSLEPLESDTGAAGTSPHGTPQCCLCGRGLPPGRVVNFCPHCGGSQTLTRCPACQSETEAGWRHCVSCGLLIGGR
jgi:hypothetical protein